MWWYVYIFSSDKQALFGPYNTEAEAESKGRSVSGDDGRYKAISLDTRDIRAATSQVKAQLRNGSLDDITKRMSHKE